ncbi:hypothetical protein HK100_010403, partial [Physocladia obscura]
MDDLSIFDNQNCTDNARTYADLADFEETHSEFASDYNSGSENDANFSINENNMNNNSP